MKENDIENVSEAPTHKWRCINCGKMAYSYICSYCGKESYYKTNNKENGNFSTNKEHNFPRTNKSASLQERPETDTANELKIISKSINVSAQGTKGLKNKIVALIMTVVLFGLVFVFLNLRMQSEIKKLVNKNKELKTRFASQSLEADEPSKSTNNNSINTVQYTIHIVKTGETLETICNNYKIDYMAYKNIIVSINGIANPNIISVGQAIILPVLN